MATLAIDLETYSDNDIKYGVYKYVDSPNFEILLLGYSFDDGPVQVVDLTKEEMPVRVAQALFDSSITKTAFNANFEITCFKKLYPQLLRSNGSVQACWRCTIHCRRNLRMWLPYCTSAQISRKTRGAKH